MVGEPSRIIELTRRIQVAAQEAARYQQECQRLIAQLAKEESRQSDKPPATRGHGRSRPRVDHANALPARIIRLLAKSKKSQKPASIFKALALPAKQKTTLFTTLHRLTKEGRLMRDANGYHST